MFQNEAIAWGCHALSYERRQRATFPCYNVLREAISHHFVLCVLCVMLQNVAWPYRLNLPSTDVDTDTGMDTDTVVIDNTYGC